ncbi:MaoC family dehydratase N-terminal domain-containing protein, partial [Chloroflexota bacterium]
AVEDDNQMWREAAPSSRVIVPPYMYCSVFFSGGDNRPELPLPYQRLMDGGGEWESYEDVYLGDIITTETTFTRYKEREGRAGNLIFLDFESIHQNQHGRTVAKSKTVLINLDKTAV